MGLIQNKSVNYKSWHAWLFVVVILVAVVLGVVQRVGHPKIVEESNTPVESIILNEQTCGVSGGVWNSCGSACRTTPELVCMDVCVEYCECTSSSQCPFGFSCIDLVNGTGVCEE
ncbi:MAG: hypothetical protein Q8P30_04935 [Candidatus Uhrbacteria bacterium]|nr:hypothetical protein [Candidatus Uhrbacteria bacterium]